MNEVLIERFTGKSSIKIIEAMEMIDRNAHGILFIVDDNDKLCGCVTDGDIRRWIIRCGDLSVKIADVMNTSPTYVFADSGKDVYKIMKRAAISVLPIIDRNRRLVDIVLMSDEDGSKYLKPKRGLSDVPVVIMAGGKGTRLYPYTKILPKPLIPIGDTPIVERVIDCFVEHNIHKYYMTVNYKKSMIKSYFTELNPKYEIVYVEEDKPLGTGGSIKLIQTKFDSPIIVTNCDALVLADYADVYDYHVDSGNLITMVSALKNVSIPYGVLHTGENGELIEIEEKPKLSYLINTGMYIVNPEVIELIPEDTMFHMTQLIERVMENGGKVGTYPISEDSFLDMGEFSEMKRMEEKLNIATE